MTLDRNELVVAEHDTHHPTRLRITHQVGRQQVRRGASEDQSDLVGHAVFGHDGRHRFGVGGVEGERLLAEDRLACLRRPFDQLTVLGGPGADVDRVASVDDLVGVGHDVVSRGGGEPLRPIGIDVVHADPFDQRTGRPQHLGVERGDVPSADESDPQPINAHTAKLRLAPIARRHRAG